VRRIAPDPLAEITAREAQAVLDEELARLPERLRAPLVLCHLEGATRDEAARQLGCSLATLKRRLHKGREPLRPPVAPRRLAAAPPGGGVRPGCRSPRFRPPWRRRWRRPRQGRPCGWRPAAWQRK